MFFRLLTHSIRAALSLWREPVGKKTTASTAITARTINSSTFVNPNDRTHLFMARMQHRRCQFTAGIRANLPLRREDWLFLHRPVRGDECFVPAREGIDVFVSHSLRNVGGQCGAESTAAIHD